MGNASLIRQQGPQTTLTKKGRKQAQKMARHMKDLGLEVIIASPFSRAQSTAHDLHDETGLPITTSELFIERRRPHAQLARKKIHPHSLFVQLQLALFSSKATWRHSDEETPGELLLRANEALDFIWKRPESTIAVVTHGRFMRALYADIVLGEGVTGKAYLSLTRKLHMRNTALMVATCTDGVWEVLAWNKDAAEL